MSDIPEILSTAEIDDIVMMQWPQHIDALPPAGWTRLGDTETWWKRVTADDIRQHPLAPSSAIR